MEEQVDELAYEFHTGLEPDRVQRSDANWRIHLAIRGAQ
jgi:hypothetical protein